MPKMIQSDAQTLSSIPRYAFAINPILTVLSAPAQKPGQAEVVTIHPCMQLIRKEEENAILGRI
jgi:hypothetical protein